MIDKSDNIPTTARNFLDGAGTIGSCFAEHTTTFSNTSPHICTPTGMI